MHAAGMACGVPANETCRVQHHACHGGRGGHFTEPMHGMPVRPQLLPLPIQGARAAACVANAPPDLPAPVCVVHPNPPCSSTLTMSRPKKVGS